MERHKRFYTGGQYIVKIFFCQPFVKEFAKKANSTWSNLLGANAYALSTICDRDQEVAPTPCQEWQLQLAPDKNGKHIKKKAHATMA